MRHHVTIAVDTTWTDPKEVGRLIFHALRQAIRNGLAPIGLGSDAVSLIDAVSFDEVERKAKDIDALHAQLAAKISCPRCDRSDLTVGTLAEHRRSCMSRTDEEEKIDELQRDLDKALAKLTLTEHERDAWEVEHDLWVKAAQSVIDLFDPLKAAASPLLLVSIAEAAKAANTSMRQERDDARKKIAEQRTELLLECNRLLAATAKAEVERDHALTKLTSALRDVSHRVAALESAVALENK